VEGGDVGFVREVHGHVDELDSGLFEKKSKFPPSSLQKNPKIVHKSHCKYLI
jgi:hypothetical protein